MNFSKNPDLSSVTSHTKVKYCPNKSVYTRDLFEYLHDHKSWHAVHLKIAQIASCFLSTSEKQFVETY